MFQQDEEIRTCPISSKSYKGLCPVVSCPFNIVEGYASTGSDCIKTSYYSQLTEKDVRMYLAQRGYSDERLEEIIAEFRQRVAFFQRALNSDEDRIVKACERCGTPTSDGQPCKSSSICKERKETVNAVIESLFRQSQLTLHKVQRSLLQREHVWIALLSRRKVLSSMFSTPRLRNLKPGSTVKRNK